MNEENSIGIQAIYRENSEILWCISYKDAYLYKIDLSEGIAEEIMPLLDKADESNMFADLLGYEEFLVFIPEYSDFIVIVDRHNWKRENVLIPYTERQIGVSGAKFFTGFIYEGCLYMLGFSYPGIVKMELKSKKFSIINEWLNDVDLPVTDEVDGCFHANYYLSGSTLYLPFMNTNAVLRLDLETEETAVFKVGSSFQGYVSIEREGDNFWLIPRDGSIGSITKWDQENDVVEYYCNYPEGFNYEKYAFFRTVNLGNKILLFASDANMNISIDVSTGKMEMFPDIYDVSDIKKARYRFAELVGEKIFFHRENICVIWNYISGEKKCLPYSIEKKILERRINERENWRIKNYFDSAKNGIFKGERKEFGIEELIKYLQM